MWKRLARQMQHTGQAIIAALVPLLGLLASAHANGPGEAIAHRPLPRPQPFIEEQLPGKHAAGLLVVVVRAGGGYSARVYQYAYADGDPVNRWDPSGLDWVWNEYHNQWKWEDGWGENPNATLSDVPDIVRISPPDSLKVFRRLGKDWYTRMGALRSVGGVFSSGITDAQYMQSIGLVATLASEGHAQFGGQERHWFLYVDPTTGNVGLSSMLEGKDGRSVEFMRGGEFRASASIRPHIIGNIHTHPESSVHSPMDVYLTAKYSDRLRLSYVLTPRSEKDPTMAAISILHAGPRLSLNDFDEAFPGHNAGQIFPFVEYTTGEMLADASKAGIKGQVSIAP